MRIAFVGLALATMALGAPRISGAQVPLPSRGCGNPTRVYSPGTSEDSLRQHGILRTFRVHVPLDRRSGTGPLPLVLLFHGGGGSGEQLEEQSSGMDAVADREGFIVAYPDGTGLVRTWNAGGCCGRAANEDTDDVGFTAALLDHLEDRLCVDERRVYAGGMSNGAMMSYRLACELSDRIAAVAPVAGVDVTLHCSPSRPVAVMEIHGTADGHVPWNGGLGCGPAGVSYPSVPASMDAWRVHDSCTATKALYFEQGDGRCEKYRGCDRGSDVVLCSIQGGGHSWPGGEPKRRGGFQCPADGAQSQSFSASEAMWRFFQEHPLSLR